MSYLIGVDGGGTKMLGALATLLELPTEAWAEALRAALRPRTLEVNLRAFEAGRELLEDV